MYRAMRPVKHVEYLLRVIESNYEGDTSYEVGTILDIINCRPEDVWTYLPRQGGTWGYMSQPEDMARNMVSRFGLR